MLPIAKILHTADEVIGLVDQVALAQYMAVKSPEILERGSPNGAQAAAKQKKEMEEMKAGLIDALSRKCQALSAAVSRVGVVNPFLKEIVSFLLLSMWLLSNAVPASYAFIHCLMVRTQMFNLQHSRSHRNTRLPEQA